MHLEVHLKKIIFPLVLYIGIFGSVLNAEVEEPSLETLEKNKTVYVEPQDLVATKKDGHITWNLETYKERRTKWGFLFGGGYSTYEPINYQPNFTQKNYNQAYGQPWRGMLEGNFTVKRNFDAFSAGVELSAGNFDNDRSNGSGVETDLSLYEVRIGASIYFDMLQSQPYVVPYFSGGGYTMVYKESLGGNAVGGTSQIAPYVNAGLEFQLDWIDSRAARTSYEDSKIQSSFFYVEARKYFASSNSKDFDFGNDVNFDMGMRLEF
jgi:hypothetical protein